MDSRGSGVGSSSTLLIGEAGRSMVGDGAGGVAGGNVAAGRWMVAGGGESMVAVVGGRHSRAGVSAGRTDWHLGGLSAGRGWRGHSPAGGAGFCFLLSAPFDIIGFFPLSHVSWLVGSLKVSSTFTCWRPSPIRQSGLSVKAKSWMAWTRTAGSSSIAVFMALFVDQSVGRCVHFNVETKSDMRMM